MLAQGPVERHGISQGPVNCVFGKGLQVRRYFPRIVGRRLGWVAVDGIAAQVCSILGQALQQLARQLPGPGRSETDRAGETFAQCDAIVGVARRQVEHVACIEHKLLLGHKG